LKDEAHPGFSYSQKRHLTARMIKKQKNMTFVEIKEALGIGASTINSILHEYLGVRKLASRWIPHLLSDAQKQHHVDWRQFTLKKIDNGRSKSIS
jgi:hypothetical protein